MSKKYLINDETMTNIADAIRRKIGTSEPIPVVDMAEQIKSIDGSQEFVVATFEPVTPNSMTTTYPVPSDANGWGPVTVKGDSNLSPENIKEGVTIFNTTGTYKDGTDTSDATATADDIREGCTAYVNGKKLMGTHACTDDLNLIDAVVTPTGLEFVEVPEDGSGVDGYSSITVEGDENLISENIKQGVTVYGIEGSLGGQELQTITATPTGEEFILSPEEGYSGFSEVTVAGDYNLKPENIATGISVYGIQGTLKVASQTETIPSAYMGYVEDAKYFIKDDAYDAIMVLEQDEYVGVGFLLSGFNVESLDETTTEFTASSWFYCSYNKNYNSWTTQDWSNSTSIGGNYISNIRYCNMVLSFNGEQIYPTVKSGADLNIIYSPTAPSDTNMLWINADKPDTTRFTTKVTASESFDSTFSGSLNSKLANHAMVAVGSSIYTFGGRTNFNAYTSKIYKYDTESGITTTSSATLDIASELIAAAAVGTNIYLFGGKASGSNNGTNRIYKYDTVNDTLEHVGSTAGGSYGIWNMSAATIGNNIFLFGGWIPFSGRQQYVWRFDTLTNTFSEVGQLLPVEIESMTAVTHGTDIYLFGGATENSTSGINTIYVFDSINNTIETLSTTLPANNYNMASASIGGNIYLFGNISSTATIIYRFDVVTQTIQTLSTTMSLYLDKRAVSIGANIYIVGGCTGSSGTYSSTIQKFVANLSLLHGDVLILTSTTDNIFKLIDDDRIKLEMGVKTVFAGNSYNIAEIMPAYLHNGTEWVQI